MTLSAAVTEILEYVLAVRAVAKCVGQSVWDGIDVNLKRKIDSELPASPVFLVTVTAHGNWTRLLDSQGMLGTCPVLTTILQPNQRDECLAVDLLKCRLKTQSSEEVHIISQNSGEINIQKEMTTKPPIQCTHPECCITFELLALPQLMRTCSSEIRNYLCRYKLVNPKVTLNLTVSIDSEEDHWDFGSHLHGYKSVLSDITILTDLHYFMRSDDTSASLSHIRPVSGGRFVFLSPHLPDGSRISLKCVAAAALIPPRDTDGQAFNCSELWLGAYGPGSFPLQLPASSLLENQLNLMNLANWEDFGLALANQNGEEETPQTQPIQAVFQPDLKAQFAMPNGCDGTIHKLFLLIFIERNTRNNNFSAIAQTDLLNRVRQEFPRIWAEHFSRIKKIINDTLAKLLGSQPVRRDRGLMMKAAIPVCSAALCSIVGHSTNDAFRQQCFNVMKASNSAELSQRLSDQLFAIGSRYSGQQSDSCSQQGLDRMSQFSVDSEDNECEDEDYLNSADVNLTMKPEHLTTGSGLHQNSPETGEGQSDFDLLGEMRQVHSDDGKMAACSPPGVTSESQPSIQMQTKPVPPSQSTSKGAMEQRSDIQEVQDTLAEELGNDWFESLVEHDWLVNEL